MTNTEKLINRIKRINRVRRNILSGELPPAVGRRILGSLENVVLVDFNAI